MTDCEDKTLAVCMVTVEGLLTKSIFTTATNNLWNIYELRKFVFKLTHQCTNACHQSNWYYNISVLSEQKLDLLSGTRNLSQFRFPLHILNWSSQLRCVKPLWHHRHEPSSLTRHKHRNSRWQPNMGTSAPCQLTMLWFCKLPFKKRKSGWWIWKSSSRYWWLFKYSVFVQDVRFWWQFSLTNQWSAVF